jgi:hypothetical protein
MPHKPALATVVTQLRAGRLPSALQYGALLREAGCDQAEARSMTAAYAKDLSGHSSAEEEFMESLRAFSLGHD